MDLSSCTTDDDPGLNMDSGSAINDDPGLNMDSGSAINDDPCANMDSGSANNDDSRPRSITDSDSATHDDSRLNVDSGSDINSAGVSTSQSDSATGRNDRCVNCRVNMRRLRTHPLEIVEVRSIIQQWLLPQQIQITSSDFVCHSCWTAAWNVIRQTGESASSNPIATRIICVSCGCSLRRQRSHLLTGNSAREIRIREIISAEVAPRQLQTSSQICHPCWRRSERTASRSRSHSVSDSMSMDSDSVNLRSIDTDSPANAVIQATSILLPHYTRAADTQSRCFVPGCTDSVRLTVPEELRVQLFCDYKYYVPAQCRICYYHLRSNSWDILDNIIDPLQTFSASHIEEFAHLLQENMQKTIDFENIDGLAEHIVHFFLGFSKEQYNQLLTEVPRLANRHKGAFALAAYLIKLRTGDSDERIASLLNVPRSTLERLMKMARTIIVQDFVPRNLGINHITRAEIAQRNLLIPNTLFGGENERHPIIIADGTYIYIEKSSNYLYQKRTYSLHKYRNLIKPFLLVCSDGYIIDVLGPYPATTSDADIIINEFSNENSPYRRYFQNGDVFILDRGFRDSLSLLRSCEYSVHVPLSLQEGETQLSTINANESRTVTMCRWVVETVNGIFKKSFKLFRQTYFNRASLHLMDDFSVVAALINRFHPRYRDRDDAAQIMEVVNENRFRNNDLADFVDQRNLNRVRVNFTRIEVLTDNVQTFPQLTESDLWLFACGTYQFKQARSYYGEHIRANGCYHIEVSNDRRTSILEGSHFGDNCVLLRARIQSRHVTRKIYFVYILLQNNVTGRQAIRQYCCNCIVGRRTVGCCAHVMSVVWYLGWARHQSVLNPPAGFLDNVLLVYDEEDDL